MSKKEKIQIDYNMQNEETLTQIENLAKQHSGRYGVILHLITHKGKDQKILSNNIKFSIKENVVASIREIVGYNKVWLSM